MSVFVPIIVYGTALGPLIDPPLEMVEAAERYEEQKCHGTAIAAVYSMGAARDTLCMYDLVWTDFDTARTRRGCHCCSKE